MYGAKYGSKELDIDPVNFGKAWRSQGPFPYFFIWSLYFSFIVCVILLSNFSESSRDFINTATFTESNVRSKEVVKCSLVMEQNS